MKANRIAIREGLGRVVAMIEVVSPGNKDRRSAVAGFVAKAVDFLRNDIHVLIVDPLPTGPHDPEGLDRLIWAELADGSLGPRPAGKPLTVAAFDAGPPLTAYAEDLAVGDPWPEAPLFLAPGWYVNVPLERTYLASWEVTPRPIRDLVEPPSAGERPGGRARRRGAGRLTRSPGPSGSRSGPGRCRPRGRASGGSGCGRSRRC